MVLFVERLVVKVFMAVVLVAVVLVVVEFVAAVSANHRF